MHLAKIAIILPALSVAAREVTDCVCGFQDDQTSSVYTDSLILYFNETEAIDPAIFQVQEFAHKKEHGWNSRFKIGASASNARLANTTYDGIEVQALELLLEPPDEHHLVSGGRLQTARRDIQYGSFEAAMKPASQWTGGTVMSFGVYYNRSNGAGFDFMTENDPANAQISNLVNDEWPGSDLSTNLTILEEAGLQPWTSFTNTRFSWNDTVTSFGVVENTARLVKKEDRTLPTAGQALELKTWSIGDKHYGAGPPMNNATRSHVLYVRAFFNSSTMTQSQHLAFDERCATTPHCPTSDTTLRGYSAYGPASMLRWEEPPKNKSTRTLAGIVAACSSSFGIFALANVFLRKTPWSRLWPKKSRGAEVVTTPSCDTHETENPKKKSISEGSVQESGINTPLPQYGARTPRSGMHTPAPSYHTTALSLHRADSSASLATMDKLPRGLTPVGSQTDLRGAATGSHKGGSLAKALNRISEMSNYDKDDVKPLKAIQTLNGTLENSPSVDDITPVHASSEFIDDKAATSISPVMVVTENGKQALTAVAPVEEKKASMQVVTAPATPLAQPTKRVDYLAGLTSVACIGVTLHHFCQTFWPFVIEGYGPTSHYPEVEKWVGIFIGGIVLSGLWIGPFFLTATRFMATNYLKHGNLEDIAKKELRRAPRLFVPIIIVSILQYFLISMGLTSSLEWLPSVTYSTWPYVVAHSNFGVYMNNIIELMYMIPNAVPEITSHYCIGVLWTIPVQLQFTYVVLAATVVMRDVRNPWKRFSVYTIVILAGWYARSWSACHWAGLMLADLEATYHWRARLQKRPVFRYAILSGATICAGGSTLVGVFNQKWSFNTAENSIHPDQATGIPIMANSAVYPGYQEPTLAILLFSIGLQVLVELSTWVQAFLSWKVFLFLNPMIFCIYLTHGFVMWTWGAWVAIACNDAGLPYWANLLITLVTTYAMIFLLAWILAPLLEFPTQAVMRRIDRWTREDPKPKRATTAPFSKDLVLIRKGAGSATGEA